MTNEQKSWTKNFFYGAGLTFVSFLLFAGCGTIHKITHPFSSATSGVAQALPSVPPGGTVQPYPATSQNPVVVTLPGGRTVQMVPAREPAAATAPIPVQLASGQTILMVPAPAPAPAKATPVKSALSKLLILVWVCGIIGILVGVAFIVWLQQLWLGIKLIACCVGGIIFAEWFYVHYVGTIAVLLVAGGVWIVLDHFITWSAVTQWIEKQANTIKKNV